MFFYEVLQIFLEVVSQGVFSDFSNLGILIRNGQEVKLNPIYFSIKF